MKARVDWIVSGEIDIPDDFHIKRFMDILNYIPHPQEISSPLEAEVELIELIDIDGRTRITFDFSPADIRLYEGGEHNERKEKGGSVSQSRRTRA